MNNVWSVINVLKDIIINNLLLYFWTFIVSLLLHTDSEKNREMCKKNIAAVDKLYEDELLLNWFRNHKLYKLIITNNNKLLLININGNLTQEKKSYRRILKF